MCVLLENKEKIENIRCKYNHVLSSHSFVSLYLWRKHMGIDVYLEDDLFSAKCAFKGDGAWMFPCGNDDCKYSFIRDRMNDFGFKLCYMSEYDVEFLERNFPGKFKFQRDRTSDEYIYSIEEHRSLKGKHYANVRTQYNKIRREHELWCDQLNDGNVDLAIEVLEEWDLENHGNAPIADDGVDSEALLMRRELGIDGILVYVDGHPMAVAAGFPLTDDTFDVCIAKGAGDIPGLAYYAKHEMFVSLPEYYKYINLEEDLGMEGLITMKSILYPVRKNKIWEATVTWITL